MNVFVECCLKVVQYISVALSVYMYFHSELDKLCDPSSKCLRNLESVWEHSENTFSWRQFIFPVFLLHFEVVSFTSTELIRRWKVSIYFVNCTLKWLESLIATKFSIWRMSEGYCVFSSPFKIYWTLNFAASKVQRHACVFIIIKNDKRIPIMLLRASFEVIGLVVLMFVRSNPSRAHYQV